MITTSVIGLNCVMHTVGCRHGHEARGFKVWNWSVCHWSRFCGRPFSDNAWYNEHGSEKECVTRAHTTVLRWQPSLSEANADKDGLNKSVVTTSATQKCTIDSQDLTVIWSPYLKVLLINKLTMKFFAPWRLLLRPDRRRYILTLTHIEDDRGHVR